MEDPLKKTASLLSQSLPDVPQSDAQKGFFTSLQSSLKKTRGVLFDQWKYKIIDAKNFQKDFLQPLIEKLLLIDIGIETVNKIQEKLLEERTYGRLKTGEEIWQWLEKLFIQMLDQTPKNLKPLDEPPTVIFAIGSNGVGKTTSLGKLAYYFGQHNKKVLLAAGDTYRAGAAEQLAIWSERSNAGFHAKGVRADPAAVIYEAAQKAKTEQYDVLLCDTAGRMHTKKNLMDELSKMQKTVQKVIPQAPHYSWLVLDANIGQSAVQQVKEFANMHKVNGLILTKLDGSSKGGIVLGIVNEWKVPVYFVGVGEKMEDLRPFQASDYVKGLLQEAP